MTRERKVLSNHQKKMSKYYSQERILDYNFDEVKLGEDNEKESKIETRTYQFIGYCSNQNCLNMLSSCDRINENSLIFKCFKCGSEIKEEEVFNLSKRNEIKKMMIEEDSHDWCWENKILEDEEEEDDEDNSKSIKNSEVEDEEENSEVENEDEDEDEEEEKINYYIENFLSIEEE